MLVDIETTINAPRAVVWDVLVDWEGQSDWMIDAVEIEVVSPHRSGLGTTVRSPTRILGIVIPDVVRVIEWRHRERLTIVHLGSWLVQGTAAIELADTPELGTHVRWTEDVPVPLGRLGPTVGRFLLRPFLEIVFRRSLRRLKLRCEAASQPLGG
ncbi:MAG: SRPBCC family protein [Nitriliruptorales bacterium]|nr:SRPBCC family protein [Nitriliruptorales bacterium]